MNIDLKPIAESKVRQLGGDVCGVLVRTEDSEVMVVSEHGRCTRLDAGVMGPVSNAPASDRDEFQQWLLNEHGLYSRWQEDRNCFADFPAHLAWKAWQAARAQGGQGAEVATDDVTTEFDRYKRAVITGARRDKVEVDKTFSFADFHAGYRAGRWSPDRPAAQQGSVPNGENDFGLDARYFHEKLSLILRDINSYTPTEMARALGRLAITANPETMREPEFSIRDLIDEPKYRDTTPQPAVPEWVRDLRKAAKGATPGPWHGGHGASPLTACVDWRDDDGNMTSDCFVKTGGHAKVVCKAEPRSWRDVLQASKDIAFISAANPAAVLELISLLSTPATPQADGLPATAYPDPEGVAEELVDRLFAMREGVYRIQMMVGNMYCESGVGGFNKQALLMWMTGNLRELLPAPIPPAGQEGA